MKNIEIASVNSSSDKQTSHPPLDIQHLMRAGTLSLASLPPLSLYIHLPWCLKKCPYCDFNSHALSTGAAGEPVGPGDVSGGVERAQGGDPAEADCGGSRDQDRAE